MFLYYVKRCWKRRIGQKEARVITPFWNIRNTKSIFSKEIFKFLLSSKSWLFKCEPNHEIRVKSIFMKAKRWDQMSRIWIQQNNNNRYTVALWSQTSSIHCLLFLLGFYEIQSKGRYALIGRFLRFLVTNYLAKVSQLFCDFLVHFGTHHFFV